MHLNVGKIHFLLNYDAESSIYFLNKLSEQITKLISLKNDLNLIYENFDKFDKIELKVILSEIYNCKSLIKISVKNLMNDSKFIISKLDHIVLSKQNNDLFLKFNYYYFFILKNFHQIVILTKNHFCQPHSF